MGENLKSLDGNKALVINYHYSAMIWVIGHLTHTVTHVKQAKKSSRKDLYIEKLWMGNYGTHGHAEIFFKKTIFN